MDWRGWTTFAAALVAATTGLVTCYVNWKRHRREMTQARAEEHARWSIRFSGRTDEGFLFRIQRTVVEAPELLLLSMEIERPRRTLATLARYEPDPGAGPGRYVAAKAFGRVISFHRLLGSSLDRADQSSITFLCRSESRSARRLVIRLVAEETSSLRRQIQITVSSQVIDWTASKHANAT